MFYNVKYSFSEIEDVSLFISQLHHEVLKWPEIESIWLKTTNYRLKNIKEVGNIFINWKHFKEPMGYRLVSKLYYLTRFIAFLFSILFLTFVNFKIFFTDMY